MNQPKQINQQLLQACQEAYAYINTYSVAFDGEQQTLQHLQQAIISAEGQVPKADYYFKQRRLRK